VVTDESVPRQTAVQDRGGLYKLCKQSEPSQSLYCLMQDLQRLSLQDEGWTTCHFNFVHWYLFILYV